MPGSAVARQRQGQRQAFARLQNSQHGGMRRKRVVQFHGVGADHIVDGDRPRAVRVVEHVQTQLFIALSFDAAQKSQSMRHDFIWNARTVFANDYFVHSYAFNLPQHNATQNVGNFWFEIGLDLPGHVCDCPSSVLQMLSQQISRHYLNSTISNGNRNKFNDHASRTNDVPGTILIERQQ